MRKATLLTLCGLSLAGCEQLGIETPAQIAAVKEAEGRAVGGACRHSGRALEDCYSLNAKASKAAIFSGWRDMDAYMRENNIEVVASTVPRPETSAKTKKILEEEVTSGKTSKPEDAPAKKEGAAAQSSTDLPLPARGGKIS